jgi:aspartyl-tRNA(Asn)/glutamyl-tRNA(Gln) amidotransferase subunit A
MEKKNIQTLQQELQAGKYTCEELISELLQKLEANEHNANNSILKEQALSAARNIDTKIKNGEKLGQLDGVPFGIKDVFLIQGTKATASSEILGNYISPYTATAVQKALDAGAIPLVKENCDTFGHGSTNENSVFGPVKNALNPSLVSGGSSGGSAVNVATGLTLFSIGGDTGGSIRQPAGYNKVYGMKPTYGRISRYGLMAYTSSTDCVGPFAHSIEDLELVMNVLSGKDEKDQTSYNQASIQIDKDFQLSGKKIGVYKNFIENAGLDQSIKKSFEGFLEKLSNKGVSIEYLDFFEGDTLTATYYITALAETASNLSRIDGVAYGKRIETGNTLIDSYIATRTAGFTEESKRRITAGNQVLSEGYADEIYKKALDIRKDIEVHFMKDFEKVDFIISPVSPTLAPKIGEAMKDPVKMYLSDLYTVGFSLGGLPTLSAPCEVPNNIQISGKLGDDNGVINFANALTAIQ